MEEKSKTPLLIFDLDGTLVDSSLQIFYCINEAMKVLLYPELDYETFLEKFGLPIEVILDDLNLETHQLDSLVNRFRQFLALEVQRNNIIYSGVEAFLLRARDFGFKTAIATSKPTNMAELVVNNSLLSNYIDFTQGTDDFPAKPEPDVIIKCLDYFKTRYGLMFGDRIEDVLAANLAHIPCIGVAQGHHSAAQLRQVGAIKVYDNFLELSLDAAQLFKIFTAQFSATEEDVK